MKRLSHCVGERIKEWVSSARQEVDRLNPARDVDQFRFTRPEDVPFYELDKYMPAGMTTRIPPH